MEDEELAERLTALAHRLLAEVSRAIADEQLLHCRYHAGFDDGCRVVAVVGGEVLERARRAVRRLAPRSAKGRRCGRCPLRHYEKQRREATRGAYQLSIGAVLE